MATQQQNDATEKMAYVRLPFASGIKRRLDPLQLEQKLVGRLSNRLSNFHGTHNELRMLISLGIASDPREEKLPEEKHISLVDRIAQAVQHP